MPYASNRDRDPPTLELVKVAEPAAPLNLFMTSGYQPGVVDLSWTDPSQLSVNSNFQICGVNIYRSFDSEFGPYDRINPYPLGGTFWRDQTNNVLVQDEQVTDWVMFGDAVAAQRNAPRYVFRTSFGPIVKEGSQNIPANTPSDVEVRIDGMVARVARVTGETWEVEIDPNPYPNVTTQLMDPGIVPGPDSVVTVSYRYNRSFVRTDLSQRIFYRVTTVGTMLSTLAGPADPHELLETQLARATLTSTFELEKVDWVWREAVRRNRWILDQGGERVKVFIRKQVGPVCPCFNTLTHHQPVSDCTICYGVGVIGGYEGPYDIILAPDDAERKIGQRDTGRTVEHSYEVWTTSSPLLSQRDFIVKINGERYSIGPVRMPSNRGMLLQQHFNIGHLDEKMIQYRVPIDGPNRFLPNQAAELVPPLNSPAQITDKPEIPDERELKGRTKTWVNIVY